MSALDFARGMRPHDRFHPEQDSEILMSAFFPETPAQLARDLSQVTSLFYGLLLQLAAEQLGPPAVDRLSRGLFYRLGRAKTRATREQTSGRFALCGDVRDLVTILISAIYNASPEYQFHVEHYACERCVVHLTGVDRYYRAAAAFGLVEQLRWPPLHAFFEGIRDELGLVCEVHSELLTMTSDAQLHARYTFNGR